MGFSVKISGAEKVRSTLGQLVERMTDATPAMQAISMILLRESKRIFAQEGRGAGLDQDWRPLSEVTLKRRAARGETGKILQVSGKLAASITPTHTATRAGITTNHRYAAMMFFGAKQGYSGRDKRNHPIPWGDIPARPYFPARGVGSGQLRLTERAEKSVLAHMQRYLET